MLPKEVNLKRGNYHEVSACSSDKLTFKIKNNNEIMFSILQEYVQCVARKSLKQRITGSQLCDTSMIFTEDFHAHNYIFHWNW